MSTENFKRQDGSKSVVVNTEVNTKRLHFELSRRVALLELANTKLANRLKELEDKLK